MISIRNSITQEAQAKESLHATMAAYLTTLEKLQRYAPPFQEGFVDSFRQNLRNIAAALEAQATPDFLRKSAGLVAEELKSLWESSRGVVSRWQDDCRSLVKTLADAARGMEARDRTCNAVFRRFSDRVGSIAASSDMNEIRLRLREELTLLKSSVDEMMHESGAVLTGMQQAVEQAEVRFKQVHIMAFEDALTRLPNRRRSDVILQEKIRSGQTWCAILLDVDQFKQVNDAFGHACGDAVLQYVANSLKKAVPATDTVSRWAGDEFLVILGCDLLAALDVSTAIARHWGPRYLEVGDSTFHVAVSASAGICQYIRGETAESFLARVDQEMYREKQTSRR